MAELTKKRVTVSFAFDVTVDDEMIFMAESDEEVKTLDLALLKHLLTTDEERVKLLIADQVALYLDNWNIDVLELLTGRKSDDDGLISYCFTPAIEALPEPERTEWRDIRDKYGNLSECVEQIIECFETKLVESRIEVTTPEDK